MSNNYFENEIFCFSKPKCKIPKNWFLRLYYNFYFRVQKIKEREMWKIFLMFALFYTYYINFRRKLTLLFYDTYDKI